MAENGQPVGEYIAVKALENGVTVTGVTRGAENKFLHTEKLEEGEVWIAQFTELPYFTGYVTAMGTENRREYSLLEPS